MDTLQHDLDQAIPHLTPSDPGGERLLVAGRSAVRRRRGRLAAVLAAGGLVVVAGAVGMAALLPGSPEAGVDDRAATSAPTRATGSASPSPAPEVTTRLSLASLQAAVDACELVAWEPRSGRVTIDGEVYAPTEQVDGPGWVAFGFPCGPDVVGVLQRDGRAVAARHPADDGQGLEEWARAIAEGGRP